VVNCPVNPPNAACDDGDDCTFDEAFYPADRCTGASACAGTSSRPDGDPCTFPCTTGTGVAWACAGGRCAPLPGLCDPPPACAAP
ncbi:MAG TPA: hypothetical protein VLT47_11460, partial [Anaeromyxobacteraceae bacterium]|nr:hypothetical protein [Anaeromyxobacteraceae bacterium]